jgi:hypothetical protein
LFMKLKTFDQALYIMHFFLQQTAAARPGPISL